MSQTSKILHHCKHGDLLLLGLSKKHSNHWISAGIIIGTSIMHSIHTSQGPQAVLQNLAHFLDHQAKPVGLFRFKDDKLLEGLPKLIKALESQTQTKPNWFQRIFRKIAPIFRRDNNEDVTRIISRHFEVDALEELEQLGLFVRLL